MADDTGTLQQQVLAAVATLEAMEGHLKSTQAEIQQLPFFARALVDRDVSGATGRGFADWLKTAAALRNNLAPLAASPSAQQTAAARQSLASEQPRLAKLRAYLLRAPDRLKQAPAGILKPQRQAELARTLQQQAEAIGALEGMLSSIASQLT